MQMLKVLIEENALGAVRPVEVVADVPMSMLLPVLVEELHLPKTDLFGKKLFYQMRQTLDGRIIPEEASLRDFGVQPGARLALDAHILENSLFSMATFGMRQGMMDPELYSSETLSDQVAFPEIWLKTGQKGKRSRRAFLALGGAFLGFGVAGGAYAAYHAWGEGVLQSLVGGARNEGITMQKDTPIRPVLPAMMAAALPTNATVVFNFQQHKQIVRTVIWSNVGNVLASGGDDQKIIIWRTDGTVQRVLQPGASVRALAWTVDGQRLVAGAGNQVVFYNAQSGQRLARGRKHNQPVLSVAWSGQGQQLIVSGGQDTKAFVWDSTQYQARQTFARHTSAIEGVSWAADGETVASVTQGGVVRVWSGVSGQERHGYYLNGTIPVRAVAFAPAGTQLAVGGDDGIIRLWKDGIHAQQQVMGNFGMQCVDPPQNLQVAQSPIRSLAWSADGRFLLSGAEDGTIAVWYPGQKQTPLLTVKQNGVVHGLSWSPDGKMFASAMGTVVTLWKLA